MSRYVSKGRRPCDRLGTNDNAASERSQLLQLANAHGSCSCGGCRTTAQAVPSRTCSGSAAKTAWLPHATRRLAAHAAWRVLSVQPPNAGMSCTFSVSVCPLSCTGSHLFAIAVGVVMTLRYGVDHLSKGAVGPASATRTRIRTVEDALAL